MKDTFRKEKLLQAIRPERAISAGLCLVGVVGFFLPAMKSVDLLGGKGVSLIRALVDTLRAAEWRIDATVAAWMLGALVFGGMALVNSVLKKADGLFALLTSLLAVGTLVYVGISVGDAYKGVADLGFGWFVSLGAFVISAGWELFLLFAAMTGREFQIKTANKAG